MWKRTNWINEIWTRRRRRNSKIREIWTVVRFTSVQQLSRSGQNYGKSLYKQNLPVCCYQNFDALAAYFLVYVVCIYVRMRLQRRFYHIYTVCFLIFITPCRRYNLTLKSSYFESFLSLQSHPVWITTNPLYRTIAWEPNAVRFTKS